MELSVDPVDAKNIAAQGIRASQDNAPAKFVTAISRFEERLQSEAIHQRNVTEVEYDSRLAVSKTAFDGLQKIGLMFPS